MRAKTIKTIGDFILFIFIAVGMAILLGLVLDAEGQEVPPHIISGHMTHEDSTNWYHTQALSDGTTREHTVRKPRPPNPYVSRRLIATNNLPVQVQYVYRVTREDGTIITNTITRSKTPRERIKINLPDMPPMPEIQPRGKLDALGHALRRSREERALERIRTGAIVDRQEEDDRFIFTFENKEKKVHLKKEMTPTFIARAKREIRKTEPVEITHKVMAARDPVIRRQVVGGKLQCEHASGEVSTVPLKRVHTARVQSAPVYDPDDFIFHPDGDFCAIGCKPANTNKTKEAIHGKTRAR